MKNIVICIAILIIFESLLGCHTYSSHSWDTRLTYAELDNLKRHEVPNGKFQEVYVEIRNSAKNYGFEPDFRMSDEKSKVLLKENEPQNTLKELYGSDGRISIAIYTIPSSTSDHYTIRIFIRDFTYN